MARKPKPSGRNNRSGPWTYKDCLAGLKLDGWWIEDELEHVHMAHATRKGKPQLDKKWDALKTSHRPFRMLKEQTGYSTRELRSLFNGIPLSKPQASAAEAAPARPGDPAADEAGG